MGKIKGSIEIDIDKCKGCELCKAACPVNVIAMAPTVNKKGYHYPFMENPENCTGCVNCAIVCPDAVITVYRMKVEHVEL